MAMHWIGKVGYGAIGVAAAVATALGAAASGVVTLVGSTLIGNSAAATPVAYPPMSETTRLELALGNGLPMQLRGLYFDPNERVDIFVLSKPELPATQYQLWMQATTNAAGKFEQGLSSLPANTPETFYVSARGKRGFVVPIGPVNLPKAAATQAPAPTAAIPASEFQPTLVPPSQPAAPLPAPTATPVDTEPMGSFYVEVFNNRDLAGAAISKSNEPAINENRGNTDAFSARYLGKFNFAGPESYEFVIVADDGVRLFIDNNPKPVLNEWRVGKSRELRVDVPLTSGEHHIKLEYFHKNGNAQLSLRWGVNYSRWEARYYNTPDWTGPVVFKRNDGDADGALRMTTWGDGSPEQGLVNADNFSVIWERRVLFAESGDYKFNLDLDDGAKVYVDGMEVFGNLKAVGTPNFTRKLGRGYHQLQVSYAEYGGEAKMKFEWALIPSAPAP